MSTLMIIGIIIGYFISIIIGLFYWDDIIDTVLPEGYFEGKYLPNCYITTLNILLIVSSPVSIMLHMGLSKTSRKVIASIFKS